MPDSSPPSSSPSDDRVTDLVNDFVSRRARGETVNEYELYQSHPELAEELRSAISTAYSGPTRTDPDTPTHDPSHAIPGQATVPSTPMFPPDLDIAGAGVGLPAADSIPGYTILEKISGGGQGVVFQAIQLSTKRKVALKVLREGPFASAREKVRFEREIDVLATLKHRNIVNILDSGIADGRYYYAMEYIAGRSLDLHLLEETDLRARMQLFLKICDAVHFAQLHSVVHRDLKPSNIRIDPDNEPMILDFGLAKVAGRKTVGETTPELVTVTGQFMGSLPWASPEQVSGDDGVDLRTDVYSLGVILYQMVAGRFPYDVAGPMREVEQRILYEQPARPSSVRRGVDADLETILLKSLEKSRERRYQSVGELGADMRRYLDGAPIIARPPSVLYLLRKRIGRNRTQAAVIALVSVIILSFSFSGVYLLGMYRQSQGEISTVETQSAQAIGDSARILRETAVHVTAAQIAERRRDRAEQFSRLMVEQLQRSGVSLLDAATLDEIEEAIWWLFRPERDARPPVLTADMRLSNGPALTLFGKVGSGMPALDISVSHDGRRLATANLDRTVTIWTRATGLPERTVQPHDRPVMGVVFSPDASRLITNDDRGTVAVIDANRAAVVREHAHEGDTVRAVAVSEQIVAVGHGSGAITLWDLLSGARRKVLTGHAKAISGLVFLPDGQRLLSGSSDGEIRVWTMGREEAGVVWPDRVGDLSALALSPDGTRLATAQPGGVVQLWDVDQHTLIATHARHSGVVWSLAFSPDGEWLASAGSDRLVGLWRIDADTEAPLVNLLPGHAGPVTAVEWLPASDAERFVSVGHDGIIRSWNAQTGGEDRAIRSPVFWSPIGVNESNNDASMTMADRWFVGAPGDKTGRRLTTSGTVTAMTFSGNATRIAAATDLGRLTVWESASGEDVAEISAASPETLSLALAADGSWLAAGRGDGSIANYDLSPSPSGTPEPRIINESTGAVNALVISNDGRRLVWGGGGDNRIRWVEIDGHGEPTSTVRELAGHTSAVQRLSLSADGALLISGDEEGEIRKWQLDSGPTGAPLRGHRGAIAALHLASDGRTLVSHGRDDEVVVWDLISGVERARYHARAASRVTAAADPKGTLLAVVAPSAGRTLTQQTIELIPLKPGSASD